MSQTLYLKNLTFLVYGIGSTGKSVINFFNRKKINKFFIWDDNLEIAKKYKKKKIFNLKKNINKIDYIILSPGVSLKTTKHKDILVKNKKKIISDLDLLYLTKSKFKSIVVTGTNGKSTTCKIIYHLLKKNNFKVQLGGNIGVPLLNLKLKNNFYYIIEASSYQLSHSKFIKPNYAILLNISNDHLDWHGSLKDYVNSKFKIFKLQSKKDFAFIDNKNKKKFNNKKFLSKLINLKDKKFLKIKSEIKNIYLKNKINSKNIKFVFTLSEILKIKNRAFVNAMNSFKGLPHRYEIFLKRKNIIFVNDSKATSFEASKNALLYSKNIYWILGGKPKQKDKFNLSKVKQNIVKSYIIGKNINFFKNQLNLKVKFSVENQLKNALVKVLQDISYNNFKNNIILFSPAAASFDQYKNFEERGNEFKRLSRIYAKKFI